MKINTSKTLRTFASKPKAERYLQKLKDSKAEVYTKLDKCKTCPRNSIKAVKEYCNKFSGDTDGGEIYCDNRIYEFDVDHYSIVEIEVYR